MTNKELLQMALMYDKYHATMTKIYSYLSSEFKNLFNEELDVTYVSMIEHVRRLNYVLTKTRNLRIKAIQVSGSEERMRDVEQRILRENSEIF